MQSLYKEISSHDLDHSSTPWSTLTCIRRVGRRHFRRAHFGKRIPCQALTTVDGSMPLELVDGSRLIGVESYHPKL